MHLFTAGGQGHAGSIFGAFKILFFFITLEPVVSDTAQLVAGIEILKTLIASC